MRPLRTRGRPHCQVDPKLLVVVEWSHKSGEKDHPPDPRYNGNGLPAFWTCNAKNCGDKLLLNGLAPPITTPARHKPVKQEEPPLSSQP